MKRFYKYLMVPLFAVLVSCIKESDADSLPQDIAGNQVDATFILQLPQGNAAATRAMDAVSENTVNRVDILAFKVDGSSERFAYHAKAIQIADAGSPDKKKFTVRLLKGGADRYRFVLLANLPASQGDALDRLSTTGTKTEILKAIVCSSPAGWKADGTSTGEFSPIPMWGQTDPMYVTDEVAVSGINGVRLLRMLSRVDVLVSTPEARNVFKMKSVYVYNRKTRGCVAPAESNFNSSPGVVTAASLPPDNLSGDPLTVREPLLYNTMTTADVAIRESIYLFEADAPQSGLHADATCLVVGGYYNGNTELSYYRLDFTQADHRTFSSLLRNQCFQANITAVTGRGYDTPEDAFEGNSLLDVEISVWDNASNSVVFDGQHKVTFSRDRVDAGNEAFSATVDVTTDYPGNGAEFIAGILRSAAVTYTAGASGWLTVTNTDGTNGSAARSVKFTGTANTKGTDRAAEVTFTVGNFNYVFKVNQSKDPWITFASDAVYIMDGEIHFVNATSNFDWTVDIKPGTNAGEGMSTLFTRQGGRSVSEKINFSTFDDWAGILSGQPHKRVETAYLTFRDKNGVCPDKDLKVWFASGLIQGQSNCYMMRRNSSPVLIPVMRANQPSVCGTKVIGIQINDTQPLDWQFMWTDSSFGYSPNGVVRAVDVAGDGARGYLLVRPGNSNGNAEVAAKAGGNIVWSWHVWVTDYVPSGQWMDRNLGALSNTPGDILTMGLMYQWGRKDPFPGARDIWYDAYGNLKPEFPETSDSSNDLIKGTRNPMLRIGNTANLRNNAWGYIIDKKEIYDPCPSGYRVPRNNAWDAVLGSFVWGSCGKTLSSMGGYYPAAGIRNSHFELSDVNVAGHYWTTYSPNSTGYSSKAYFTSSSFIIMSEFNSSNCSVRCTREY